MSVRLLTWAFEQDLPCAEKFVLVALADMADENGKCWPSQTCLAKRCGMTRETANRRVRMLADAGFIRVERRFIGKGQAENRYFVGNSETYPQVCDAGSQRCDVASQGGVTLDHSPPVSDDTSHRENIEIFPPVSDDTSHGTLRKKVSKKEDAPPLRSPPNAEPMNRASDDAPSSCSPTVVEKSHVRGTRLSADWQPSAADCEFAYALGLDPGETADEFADYWRALVGPKATKLDWPATWRNWCRRQQQRQSGGNRSNGLSIAAALSRVRFADEC